MGEGHKAPSFCGNPVKNLLNFQHAACKVILLTLCYHQDSQVVIYINQKL